MEKGYNVWLCRSTKEGDRIMAVGDCHTAYHVEMKLYAAAAPPGTATECSVISDLTEV